MPERSWVHGAEPGFVVAGWIRDSDKIEIHLVFDRERRAQTALADEKIDRTSRSDIENIDV
jgi:hypothetical protein